jgi:2-polyprenyl-3-methyl-5-hydroxy-6-metoxy-1,4-benzoquinol methylase
MLRWVRVSGSESDNVGVTVPAAPFVRRAMKSLRLNTLTDVARKGRNALRRAFHGLARKFRRPVPGRFQPYNHTLPDRYPWLFQFAAARLGDGQRQRILSFGCSRGEEVFSLRNYFPDAAIKGIDIDPRNIDCCLARARAERSAGMTFVTAATTEGEEAESYDAIFCLAVLCLADLSTSGAQRCDPYLHFDDFERMVADFARCLKPGGLLLLHTTNFRFCDTTVSQQFDTVLEAEPAQLAPDVLFDRGNRLMKGERYYAVAFRKRDPANPEGA